MLNEGLLYMGDKRVKYGLDKVLKRRYGVTLDKSIRENFKLGIVGEDERSYAVNDITYLFPLQADQEREINRAGLSNASRIENQLSYIVGQIEDNGMPFDVEQYLQQLEQIYKLRSDAAKIVNDIMGIDYMIDFIDDTLVGGFPINSPIKAVRALEQFGFILPIVKVRDRNTGLERETRPFSTSNLTRYLHKEKDDRNRQLALAILEYKKWDKALTWDYQSQINPVTNRIHGNINQLATDNEGTASTISTGRTSMRDPNLQQVTNEFSILQIDEKGKLKPAYSGINFRTDFKAPAGS